ncbi:MAG: cobalamin-dependent protein [Myxococcaceae bacterium]|nr:cobalamin-dependent protein [Myxococcaceae bacterium]
MKILLVNPSRFFSGEWGSGELNHLLVLFSHLRVRCPDVEVGVLDLERELGIPSDIDGVDWFSRHARAALASIDFDLIGISCWTSLHYLSTMEVARLAKEVNPECQVVVGGYHPSACPEDFDAPGTPVDWVVIGEGEAALEQIVRGRTDGPLLDRGGHLPRRLHGTPVDPAGQTLLWGEYRYYRGARIVPLWSSRGCPFQCSFCLDRLSRWRALEPERVITELRRIRAAIPSVEAISLMDPIFGLNRTWRRDFLKRLGEEDLPLRFWAETRADVWPEEDVALLTGRQFQLDIGLDAVSPRMIEIMQKARDPAKYLAAFQRTSGALRQHQVRHKAYLIINYPGETLETLEETLTFCQAFRERNPEPIGTFSAQPFKFFPGNLISSNLASYRERFGTHVMHPAWWKLRQGPYHVLSARVVASRELADEAALFTPFKVVRAINALWSAAAEDDADRLPTPSPPAGHVGARLRESVYVHALGDGEARLTDFATGRQLPCDARRAAWLAGQAAPAAGDDEEQRGFWAGLVAAGLAEWSVEPPPPSQPVPIELVLHTTAGDLDLRLFGDAAPHAVACFLQAVALGHYQDTGIEQTLPGVSASGGGTGRFVTPPYTLAPETNSLPARRGAVVMDIARHPFQFSLVRQADPSLAPRGTVIGEVLNLDVLDDLLVGDRITRVSVAPAPPRAPEGM